MIPSFPLTVLKRRFTLLQSKIINADGGNPGFSCELIDCGNRYYTVHQGTEEQRDITLIETLFKSHTVLALEER